MRYKAIEGSQMGHGCCFDATVVDTERQEMYKGEPWPRGGEPQYEAVCECPGMEEATLIATALNNSIGEPTS